MSALVAYAATCDALRGSLGLGVAHEALSMVRAGNVPVICGRVARAPRATPETLRAYDRVVRRIARRAEAMLPFRFGTVVPDEQALALAVDALALRDALERVRGCEQMTTRVFGDARTPARATAARTGTKYMAELARRARSPELDELRGSVASLVRAERVDRHDTPPLLATMYHLVPRGRADEYRAAMMRARDVRVTVSGPWAPYAFAPEASG